MNTKILQKCLDELSKPDDTANIDYVRGMLETLIEMQPDKPVEINTIFTPANSLSLKDGYIVPPPKDEVAVLTPPKSLVDKLKADAERMNQ